MRRGHVAVAEQALRLCIIEPCRPARRFEQTVYRRHEHLDRIGERTQGQDIADHGDVHVEFGVCVHAEQPAETAGTRPEALDAPREGGADDLKKIKGVGPKLEELCNSLGFYHYDQIANWTPDEVAWVVRCAGAAAALGPGGVASCLAGPRPGPRLGREWR